MIFIGWMAALPVIKFHKTFYQDNMLTTNVEDYDKTFDVYNELPKLAMCALAVEVVFYVTHYILHFRSLYLFFEKFQNELKNENFEQKQQNLALEAPNFVVFAQSFRFLIRFEIFQKKGMGRFISFIILLR